MHKNIKHEIVKYVCDKCDVQSRSRGTITAHRQAKHEGIRFSCNYCKIKLKFTNNQCTMVFDRRMTIIVWDTASLLIDQQILEQFNPRTKPTGGFSALF